MKRRKPPIVLASAFVICLGTAAVWNGIRNPRNQDDPKVQAQTPPIPDDKVIGKSRATEPKAAVLSTLAGSKKGADPDAQPLAPGNGKYVPTAHNPSFSNYKPAPNESHTAGQWYAKDSNKSG